MNTIEKALMHGLFVHLHHNIDKVIDFGSFKELNRQIDKLLEARIESALKGQEASSAAGLSTRIFLMTSSTVDMAAATPKMVSLL